MALRQFRLVRKSNPLLVELIADLKSASRAHNAPIWRDIARRLERPRQNWAEVNVGKLSKHVEHNDTVIIPGTLLGSGSTDKPIIVAAMKVTHSARQKICDAGGSVLTLRELIMQNPNGKGIKIIG